MTDLATLDAPEAEANTPDRKPTTRRPTLGRVDRLEERRTLWSTKAPQGATPEDLLYDEFWRLVVQRINRHDIVLVIADDESWECECRVESVSPSGAHVSISKLLKRDGSSTQRRTVLGDGLFTTRYQNGAWAVCRTKDNVAVISGEGSESAAILRWLRENPRKG